MGATPVLRGTCQCPAAGRDRALGELEEEGVAEASRAGARWRGGGPSLRGGERCSTVGSQGDSDFIRPARCGANQSLEQSWRGQPPGPGESWAWAGRGQRRGHFGRWNRITVTTCGDRVKRGDQPDPGVLLGDTAHWMSGGGGGAYFRRRGDLSECEDLVSWQCHLPAV